MSWGSRDGAAAAARVDGVKRARQRRGTSCAPHRRGTRGHARRARARVWVVGGAAARRARGRASSKDAVAYLAVALAPAAVVFRNRCAAAHVCATWMLFGSARARGRGFSQRDGCPLMSAACYSPRLLLRGLVVGGARTHKGQPRLGAKHSGDFPLARPRQELLCLLCRSAEEREPAEGSVSLAAVRH